MRAIARMQMFRPARLVAFAAVIASSLAGACAWAQPAFVREQAQFEAAQRAASRCERSLTNAMQALQLFPSAREDCARQKTTPGATALEFGHITCWSDLDVATEALRQGHGTFTQLRRGGDVAAVNLHTDNAARFLDRARRCIDSAQGPVVDPERARAEARAMREPGPGGLNSAELAARDEAADRAAGVVIGRNRGAREADPRECQRQDDGVYCLGGYPLLRWVWCRRDDNAQWPKECPAEFKAEMERYALSPERRAGLNDGAYEAEADAWRSERDRARRCNANPQLTVCAEVRGKGIALTREPQPVRTSPTRNRVPSDGMLIDAINRCFSEHPPLGDPAFATYTNPTVIERAQPLLGNWPVSYRDGTVTYNAAVLDQKPLNTRVFILAEVFARHAQFLHDQKFGSTRTETEPRSITQHMVDSFLQDQIPGTPESESEIVGFVDRCLVARNLLPMETNNSPRDPRILYEAYRNISRQRDLTREFSYGFNFWPLTPISLLPPADLWSTTQARQFIPQYKDAPTNPR